MTQSNSTSSPQSQRTCSRCLAIITDPIYNYCPSCGTYLHETTSLGVGKQIYIYLVSAFLPPLGLIWTFKYFSSRYGAVQRVAFISAILTVGSLILTIWFAAGFLQGLQSSIGNINGYTNLGY